MWCRSRGAFHNFLFICLAITLLYWAGTANKLIKRWRQTPDLPDGPAPWFHTNSYWLSVLSTLFVWFGHPLLVPICDVKTHDSNILWIPVYSYMQHLEAVGDLASAVAMFERSETHRFEVSSLFSFFTVPTVILYIVMQHCMVPEQTFLVQIVPNPLN